VGIVRSLLSPAGGAQATGGSAPIGVKAASEESATTSNEPLGVSHISPPDAETVFTRTFFLLAAGWFVLVAILYQSRGWPFRR
jgi:hypothetical protein